MNFITGDKFKSLADGVYDQDNMWGNVNRNSKVIFLFTDWVYDFFLNKVSYLNNPFVLITHNADIGINDYQVRQFIDCKKLIHWFGMNCYTEHPKLTPIPIGIANSKWPHGNEELLLKVINKNIKKRDKIYCNFNILTNPNIRLKVLKKVKNNPNIDLSEESNMSQEDYWTTLASYKYAICPPGNGIDCHRIWECLYLGVIPIVQNCISYKNFADLPIIMTHDWEHFDLSKEFETNPKLDFNYWKKIIRSKID